ncbi:hypothetical protein GCM10010425_50150 [Streptomyces spororaveus]|uniref:Uncharacterized protein n=1 Tax=Streptomyces spororaveus TaxID=284039 RepID=A0ABQ3T2J1_9ACTN|nr:hypothetical protein Sspor_01700 [Streptomyces spororaveus]
MCIRMHSFPWEWGLDSGDAVALSPPRQQATRPRILFYDDESRQAQHNPAALRLPGSNTVRPPRSRERAFCTSTNLDKHPRECTDSGIRRIPGTRITSGAELDQLGVQTRVLSNDLGLHLRARTSSR